MKYKHVGTPQTAFFPYVSLCKLWRFGKSELVILDCAKIVQQPRNYQHECDSLVMQRTDIRETTRNLKLCNKTFITPLVKQEKILRLIKNNFIEVSWVVINNALNPFISFLYLLGMEIEINLVRH